MQIVTSPSELRALRREWKGTVGFVPTMGALHKGHLTLIQKSKAQNEKSIVSIFVNPTQFGENEDFAHYPRKPEADANICQKAGVDILFMPKAEDIYFEEDEVLLKAPQKSGFVLEGAARPGHFDGVLRVVLKLLHLTSPTRAYFGQKDTQQLLLIQKMARELFLPYEIVPCPTERDNDGLALSSRNAYLSEAEKKEALKISASLKEATKHIMTGELQSSQIKERALKVLEGVEVEYFEIVDRNLMPLERIIKGETIILVTARVGKVRLLDNLWI